MSPEQARGDADIDARTDVWALGVVLFEMLSGRMPYDYNRNAEVMIAMVMTRDPPPLEDVAPTVSRDLCAAVNQALQRDKERRTPSVKALADALSATRIGKRTRETLRKDAAQQRSQRPPARGRGRRVAVVLLAAAVTLALALGAVVALRGAGSPPAQAVAAVATPVRAPQATATQATPTPTPVRPVRPAAVAVDAAVAADAAAEAGAADASATDDITDDDRRARRRRRRRDDEGFK